MEKVFDKTNIESFSMRKTNKGVCESMPNDSVTFTIMDWESIDNDIKTYFLQNTGYNFFAVRFVVENEKTTNGHVFLLKKCEVDERRNKATITGESPYKALTGKNNLVELAILGGGFSIPDLIETLPNRASIAEYVQHCAIGLGKGVKQASIDFTSTPQLANEFVDLVSGFSLALDTKNIYDYKKYLDEEDRSDVTYYGMVSSGSQTIVGSDYYDVTSAFEKPTISKSFAQQVSVLDFNAVRQQGGSTYNVKNSYELHKRLGIALFGDQHLSFVAVAEYISLSASIGSRYIVDFLGYTNLSFNVPDTNKYYIKCQSLMNSSAQLAVAQTNTRVYYSCRNYYECECRIDPRIEPLDKVYVDKVGTVAVEDVEINFNGGFRGNFKGRIVGQPMQPVTIPDYGDDNDFDLVHIHNPNNFQVSAVIHLSTGQLDTYNINANSTVIVWTDSDNRAMQQEKGRMMNGTLTTDTYVETKMANEPSVVVEEKTVVFYALKAPVITRNIYNNTGQFAVDIKNPNNCDVKLYVEYSDGTLEFDVPANSTISLTQANAGVLTDSAKEKATSDLFDTVDCNFIYNYPNTNAGVAYAQNTNWVIIWEADN